MFVYLKYDVKCIQINYKALLSFRYLCALQHLQVLLFILFPPIDDWSSPVRLVHSAWTQLNSSPVRELAISNVNSRIGIHVFRTDWAASFAAANQASWPLNASCNWVDLLQVSSGQFMCCEQIFTQMISCVSTLSHSIALVLMRRTW